MSIVQLFISRVKRFSNGDLIRAGESQKLSFVLGRLSETTATFHAFFDPRPLYANTPDRYKTIFVSLSVDLKSASILPHYENVNFKECCRIPPSLDLPERFGDIAPMSYSTQSPDTFTSAFASEKWVEQLDSFAAAVNRNISFATCLREPCFNHRAKGKQTRQVVNELCFAKAPSAVEEKTVYVRVVQKTLSSPVRLVASLPGPSDDSPVISRSSFPKSKLQNDDLTDLFLPSNERKIERPLKEKELEIPIRPVGRRKLADCCVNKECHFCVQVKPTIDGEKRFQNVDYSPTTPLFDPVSAEQSLGLKMLLKTMGLDAVRNVNSPYHELDVKLKRARLLSMFSFDCEALQNPRPGIHSSVRNSGITGSLGHPSTGSTFVGTQVCFFIGVSYFDESVETAQGDFNPSDYLRFVSFKIKKKYGIPQPADVQEMVDRFMTFLFVKQKERECMKLRMFADVLVGLKEMGEKVLAIERERGDNKPIRLASTFFGGVEKKLLMECEKIYLAGFNSHRYDLALISNYIFAFAHNRKINLVKNGAAFKILVVNGIEFVDLQNLIGSPVSLVTASKMFNLTESVEAKGTMPYAFYTNLGVLQSYVAPNYDSDVWCKLNSVDKMCTRDEHEQIAKEISLINHGGFVEKYLRKDCFLTQMLFYEVRKQIDEVFGLDLIDFSVFSCSSLFYKYSTVVKPHLNGQPSFCNMRFGTAYSIVSGALTGGFTGKFLDRIEVGETLRPGVEGSPTVDNLAVLDFR